MTAAVLAAALIALGSVQTVSPPGVRAFEVSVAVTGSGAQLAWARPSRSRARPGRAPWSRTVRTGLRASVAHTLVLQPKARP